jgi:hypothetical protein
VFVEPLDGEFGVGYLNMAAWVIPGMFGATLADDRRSLNHDVRIRKAAPPIARYGQRQRVWWLTVIGNSGAMTLFCGICPRCSVCICWSTSRMVPFPGSAAPGGTRASFGLAQTWMSS